MKLESLAKVKMAKAKKIVGRGHGMGKGKTSGRGTKGQKARENVRLGFEGGQLRIIKRLPFRRGVGNKPGSNTLGITLSDLSRLPQGSKVNAETLSQVGIVSLGEISRRPLKILGTGELKIALIIEIPATPGAAKKIEAVGGKVLSAG
jgi:large subunit ribosomal protein L15